jgi:myo-inositol 2-dehydrogenase / D-chiro-inositol 1-dehydrogenase
MQPNPHTSAGAGQDVTRRHFIAGASAAALGFTVLKPELVGGAEANSRINIGLIGCGGRGQWIADLFVKNGNYNLVALADYFQDRVDAAGKKFNVPEEKRFTGLSGYKKLLEQKLDAVVIQSPPYFHPSQAADAINAGKHVYCAKPVAVDVPGCVTIEETGRRATGKKLCFLADFQTRANASYQEAVRRVKDGMIGKLVSGEATYTCGPTFTGISPVLKKDPNNPEVQLRTWGLNRILSGDVITEQNIHASMSRAGSSARTRSRPLAPEAKLAGSAARVGTIFPSPTSSRRTFCSASAPSNTARRGTTSAAACMD